MDQAIDPLIAYLEKPTRERFARVVETYSSLVWSIAYRMTRHPEDAEDISQDVFLRLIVRPPAAGEVRSGRGFLSYLVLSQVDHLRRAARRRIEREEESVRRSVEGGLPGDDWRDVADAVASLPADLKIPVELRYFAELRGGEIAEVLGLSEQTVARRMREARRLLRRRLAPLTTGAALAALRLEGAAAPPLPADLLAGLLRIGELGGALAKPAVLSGAWALKTGAIIMSAKKIIIAASLAFLFLGGLFLASRFLPERQGGKEPAAQGSPLAMAPGQGAEGPPAKAGEPKPAAGQGAEEIPAPPAGPVSLEGKVVDPAGKGISRARMRALEAKGWEEALTSEGQRFSGDPLETIRFFRQQFEERARNVPSVETNAEGYYAFRGLSPGEYRVFANHKSFISGSDSWALVEAGITARCDIRLEPGRTVAGRVVDEKGSPVPGSLVRGRTSESAKVKGIYKFIQGIFDILDASLLSEAPEATTGADGAFTLGPLAPVAYDIEARKGSVLPAEARGIQPGQEGVVLVLRPGAVIAGRVISRSRRPVGGAEVAIEEPEVDLNSQPTSMGILGKDIDVFGERRRSETAGEDGRFRIEGVAPGSYELRVRAQGFPVHVEKLEIAGAGFDVGDIVLPEGLSISGAVLDRDGSPIAGARVSAFGSKTGTAGRRQTLISGNEKPIAEAEAGPGGTFRLDGIGPGYFQVMATSADGGEAIAQGIEGGRRDLVLRLGGIAGLRGKVLDAGDGSPVAGATVLTASQSPPTATTGDDGSFELKVPLQPETAGEEAFYLRAQHPDYDPWWGQVHAGEEPVEIRMKRGPGIAGTVVDGKGDPVAGARISIEVPGIPQAFLLLTRQGPGLTAFSEPDGSFFLSSARGVAAPGVELVAWRPGVGRGRTAVLPAEGDARQEIQIVLRPASTLAGRVIDAAGGPVEGALIRLFQETKAVGELKMMLELLPVARGPAAYSDRTGSYRIGDLDPGVYRLEALASGLARKVIAPVVVGEGETRQDVTLEPGGTVSGRVVDPSGNPIAGVEVVAFPASEGDQPKAEGRPDPQEMIAREFRKVAGIGVASARTGEDGAFRLEHLSEGEFRILARAPGHPVAEGGPVRCGEELPDLVLAPYGRIAGRVVTASGAAVREFEATLTGSAPPGPFTTNRWGSLRFVHPEGRFLVEDLDAGEYGLTITASDYLPFRKKVQVKPGEEEVVEAVLEDGARVEGAVRSAEDDRPIAGAKIYVNPVNMRGEESIHKEAISDEVGKFEVRGLPEGKYSVSSWHPDYYSEGNQPPEFSVPFTEPPAPGLRLHHAGKIRGRIEGLKPVESSEVSPQVMLFRIDGGKDAETSAEKGREQPDQSAVSTWAGIGALGTFEAVSLRPGTYRIALQRYANRQAQHLPDGPPQPLGEVDVRAGETSEFRAAVK